MTISCLYSRIQFKVRLVNAVHNLRHKAAHSFDTLLPQRAAGAVEEGEVARVRRVRLSTSRLILWMWLAEPTSSPRVVLVLGMGREVGGMEEMRGGGWGMEQGRGGGGGMVDLGGLLQAIVVLSLSMELCRPPMDVSRSSMELLAGWKGDLGDSMVVLEVWTQLILGAKSWQGLVLNTTPEAPANARLEGLGGTEGLSASFTRGLEAGGRGGAGGM